MVSADAALRTGQVTPDDLSAAVEGVSSWPHGSRAVAMGSLADGRRESVGESRCGVDLALAGISVTPQVEIRRPGGGLVARVDFLVDGTMVVVEFDGKVKYADGDPAVLWAEKRREDELRALGYVVVRITWADLERPGAVAAQGPGRPPRQRLSRPPCDAAAVTPAQLDGPRRTGTSGRTPRTSGCPTGGSGTRRESRGGVR